MQRGSRLESTRILLCVLLGCAGLACTDTAFTSADNLDQAEVSDIQAQQLFAARKLSGGIVALDSKTGMTLVDFATDTTADYLPLSTVKVLLAAIYLEHRADLPSSVAFDPHQLIAIGSDSAGRELALGLRKSLGSVTVLRDLQRFGFPRCDDQRKADCTSLSSATPDSDWANALSIGESGFRVTLLGLARCLVVIANGGVMPGAAGTRILRPETVRELQAALLDTVRTGTAIGIRDRMGFLGTIGGKTGSGIGGVRPYDGIFASIAFDPAGNPKLAIVAYVRRGGNGGGAAAEICADMAKYLLTAQASH